MLKRAFMCKVPALQNKAAAAFMLIQKPEIENNYGGNTTCKKFTF